MYDDKQEVKSETVHRRLSPITEKCTKKNWMLYMRNLLFVPFQKGGETFVYHFPRISPVAIIVLHLSE